MNKGARQYKLYLWIATAIVLLGAANPFIIGWIFGNKPSYDTYKDFGPVGDWIGGSSTPFITLASFVILLAAFLAQKEELQETRKEMKLTRELTQQQSQTISRQRFENTFFQMIALHNQIVSEFNLADAHVELRGRHAFSRILKLLRNYYDQELVILKSPSESVWLEIDLIQRAYFSFFKELEPQCGHYLRNLYRIYKFIDKNKELTEEEKEEYAGIIRAQLSSYELVLLLYNGLSLYGREKFLPLMRKYRTMDNLNKSLLIEDRHYALYLST